jgi:hypothetical protein
MNVPSMNLLYKIPGEYIARAASSLPDAKTAADDIQDIIISVPRLGKVRISFRPFKQQRGKITSWLWTAENAVNEPA